MLKIIIGGLLILAVLSLIAGFIFLIKDQQDSHRLLISLKLRVILCIAMVLLIAYGLWSGELGSNAPWSSIHQ